MRERKLKLAVLDMYKGVPNQGMRSLREILDEFSNEVEYTEFDIRRDFVLPDLSFDIYISTGGPGNPLHGMVEWEMNWFKLIDDLWNYNQQENTVKKHVFFICHSFQMACHHFKLGSITKRKSKSFGVLPVHKTEEGKKESILMQLSDKYFVVESREYQIVQPRLAVFEEHGAKILSLEKIRTYVEYERAIMAVRFSNEMVGTQYHPEADPDGMKAHFEKEINRQFVITNFGEQKYHDMMEHLDDPDKIKLTHQVVIPTFIRNAIESIKANVPAMN